MPDIDVTRTHALGLAGARQTASEVAAHLGAEYGVRPRWDGDVLRVKGRGFSGALEATESAVRVTATLGLLMRPFRSAIQAEIERHLDRHVGTPA